MKQLYEPVFIPYLFILISSLNDEQVYPFLNLRKRGQYLLFTFNETKAVSTITTTQQQNEQIQEENNHIKTRRLHTLTIFFFF